MKRVTLAFFLLTTWLRAETPGSVDVKGSVGGVGFEDQNTHVHLGGSVRYYVTRRFSVEPEFQYLNDYSNHYDVFLLPNVNWDFREGPVVPYVTGGIGLMHSSFPQFRPAFRTNELLVQGGAGVKLYATQRWFIAPEFRVGSELHARISVGIGYTFRR